MQPRCRRAPRSSGGCRDCEKISQPPAPFHATPRGWAGLYLLATMVSRNTARTSRSTGSASATPARGSIKLAEKVGACAVAFSPLHDLIADHLLAAERLHGDDTPGPVLAKGKTDTGRIWVYVRDDKSFGGADPPAALFRYSRNRSGDHPLEHLHGFAESLQADAYAGYRRLYEPRRSPGRCARPGGLVQPIGPRRRAGSPQRKHRRPIRPRAAMAPFAPISPTLRDSPSRADRSARHLRASARRVALSPCGLYRRPAMLRDLNPENAFIFRITHIRNVPWILANGLHCRTSGPTDPDFVTIGSPDIIAMRDSRDVPIPPHGTLSDYIPFYFTPKSPMMYNIVSLLQNRRAERLFHLI